MKTMRILFISNEYPPETGYGGIGTYTRYMAEEMARKGHQVDVICRSRDGGEKKTRVRGVSVHRIPMGQYPLPKQKLFYPFRLFCYKTIPQSLHRLAWAKSAWEAYKRISATRRFDIIEYPDCGAEGYYFRFYSPCVVRLHTPWSVVRKLNRTHEHPLDRIYQAYLERFSVKKARLISSPSHALAKYLRRRWGLRPVNVYPNPIPSGEYKPSASGDKWVYTGRVEYRKGVHVLLKAYAQVSRQRTPPRLYLIGRPYGTLSDGRNYGDYINELIRSNNLGEKIKWIEGVEHEKIKSYLHEAAVAFFPSLWENFPYTCLEAMAAGVAPCVSDCGGFPEMVESDVSGILFRAGDVGALVMRMNQLLDNPEMSKELGSNARSRVAREFDGDIVYEQALAFYKNAIKDRDRM